MTRNPGAVGRAGTRAARLRPPAFPPWAVGYTRQGPVRFTPQPDSAKHEL
ncbi:hypothetical protein BQ8420_23380 [Nocardiopsis sp. JB363]|nr:hypothetical protein BQ8420_23380 [Nocardiopsis sp. JB363]